MSYSKDVIQRARAKLAQQKADAESRNAAKLQQAYSQQPRLRQIDTNLRLTMAKAAQTIFSQGGDAAQVMEQVIAENLALQEERTLLVQTCFAPGFLEEETVCKHCGGTGYLGRVSSREMSQARGAIASTWRCWVPSPKVATRVAAGP